MLLPLPKVELKRPEQVLKEKSEVGLGGSESV